MQVRIDLHIGHPPRFSSLLQPAAVCLNVWPLIKYGILLNFSLTTGLVGMKDPGRGKKLISRPQFEGASDRGCTKKLILERIEIAFNPSVTWQLFFGFLLYARDCVHMQWIKLETCWTVTIDDVLRAPCHGDWKTFWGRNENYLEIVILYINFSLSVLKKV